MYSLLLSLTVLLGLVSHTSAECANACNGHGKCTVYDMCICYRNWQGADCSERVCPFGNAHVDTPKVCFLIDLKIQFSSIIFNYIF